MGQYYFPLLNTHATVWLLAIIFFALSVVFLKKEKEMQAKIFPMILRLFFVVLIVTGGSLVYIHSFHWSVVVKGLLAIWLITVMEFIVTKTKKKQFHGAIGKVFWSQFTVLLVLVLYFGYVVT